MLALRKALILGATKKAICFQSVPPKNPDKADSNTFKIGLNIVSDGKGGVKVGVGTLNFGLTSETKPTTGNSITVTFAIQNNVGGVVIFKTPAARPRS